MVKKLYCSIDLEFTGFDPEKEQILEIGFAFFEIGKTGFVVTEKWSQVFRPSIEVHPKILGLTGITQAEIDNAPLLADFRDFLSDKLSEVILVAHNPVLDVRFLELAGIKLSGQTIDTLELVQFLLPTHHSYNLENLMHYFGIAHKDSHRALADCLSTISLLERMISVHTNLSEGLKLRLKQIFAKAPFSWAHLLELNFNHHQTDNYDSLHSGAVDQNVLSDFDQQIVVDPIHDMHDVRVANTLRQQPGSWLQVIVNKQDVLKLWRAGLAEGVFEPQDLFAIERFNEFLVNSTTAEELRFCLKILVWLETNWQTKTVLDLNLSFFGGQFKQFITGALYQASETNLTVCDYATFMSLAKQELEINRQVVICDLQQFEHYLTVGTIEKLSWSYINFVIKGIYNPETEIGNAQFKTEVVEILSAVDLFFGLVQIVLRKHLKQLDYVSLQDLELLQPVYYKRLVQASNNLIGKMSLLAEQASSLALSNLGSSLKQIFLLEENFVKWIELTEENVFLHAQPISIKAIATDLFGKFKQIQLTATMFHRHLLFYLSDRLGLNYKDQFNEENLSKLELESSSLDLDDSSQLQKFLGHISTPAIVIFAEQSEVKKFYKNHFLELKEKFHLLAQEYSGSGNKIFRNFRIFPNALLLATANFINKQKYNAPSATVIYVNWPKIDTKHPYVKAMLDNYDGDSQFLLDIFSMASFLANIKKVTGDKVPRIIFSQQAFSASPDYLHSKDGQSA